ncbi:MAG: hypothetical protein WCC94_06095, partial [Candidatus Bathyarchaeia archaeon]
MSAIFGSSGDVILVSATGVTPLTPDGTSCTITGPVGNLVTGAVAQVFTLIVYGSFVVGNAVGNTGSITYTITVTCGTDSGTTNFTLLPRVTLSPPITVTGRVITVSGVGFASDATGSCTLLGGAPNVVNAPTTCSISNGVLTGSFTSGITGTVTVVPLAGNAGNVPTITIVAVATISLSPTSTPPGYGSAGTSYRVIVTGGGFATGTGTRSCSLTQSAGPVGLLAGTSCSLNAYGTVTASFAVSTTAAVSPAYT